MCKRGVRTGIPPPSSAPCVEELASAIERAGKQFGMSLHWGKTQGLSVCTESNLRNSQGDLVTDDGSLTYLGVLKGDGRADSELSRRIGMAIGLQVLTEILGACRHRPQAETGTISRPGSVKVGLRTQHHVFREGPKEATGWFLHEMFAESAGYPCCLRLSCVKQKRL